MLTTLNANDGCLGCYPATVPSFSERPGVWALTFIIFGTLFLLFLGFGLLANRAGSRDGPVTSDASSATATPPDDNHPLFIPVVLGVGGGASVVTGLIILLLS
ncbi:hypothetical protein ACT3SZ_14845 [Corynebacterium sp. AOP40-9SA-29]|uniref:hypothetical protein n=1 Tax=Corynebacterium sp. AOP40-9SA-29 TaxID=3457677 RepID=UPI0040347EE9